jgi:tRNA threonylcarbamoyl adenosine modification protein (Sua5/YciO/YrdC/YwlC family)
MVIYIRQEDPQPRQIQTVSEVVQSGGVIIYPTDTLYGLGCDIFQLQAIEKICEIKNMEPSKAHLSFVCNNLSDVREYTRPISNQLFRLLKEYLPGPYTFILPASKQVPKILKNKKNTIGVRIPNNNIARAIVKEMKRPILSTTLPGETNEEYEDPEMIYRNFEDVVDLVVDGGPGGLIPSTVIDCTGPEPVIVRQGLGEWIN